MRRSGANSCSRRRVEQAARCGLQAQAHHGARCCRGSRAASAAYRRCGVFSSVASRMSARSKRTMMQRHHACTRPTPGRRSSPTRSHSATSGPTMLTKLCTYRNWFCVKSKSAWLACCARCCGLARVPGLVPGQRQRGELAVERIGDLPAHLEPDVALQDASGPVHRPGGDVHEEDHAHVPRRPRPAAPHPAPAPC